VRRSQRGCNAPIKDGTDVVAAIAEYKNNMRNQISRSCVRRPIRGAGSVGSRQKDSSPGDTDSSTSRQASVSPSYPLAIDGTVRVLRQIKH
jgi:hypothetical protein